MYNTEEVVFWTELRKGKTVLIRATAGELHLTGKPTALIGVNDVRDSVPSMEHLPFLHCTDNRILQLLSENKCLSAFLFYNILAKKSQNMNCIIREDTKIKLH
jgi:hypothetical protein